MKEDLKKHTLNLREGDWDYLESVYSASGRSVSTVIRTIISAYVDRLKSTESETADIKVEVEL